MSSKERRQKFQSLPCSLWNVREQLAREPKSNISLFYEPLKMNPRFEETRHYTKYRHGLDNINCVLNSDGHEIWVSAYWCLSDKGLISRMHDDSQRGRPTKTRLVARETTFMKISDALTLVQSTLTSGWHGKWYKVLSPLVKGIYSLKESTTSSWTSRMSCGRALVSCVRIRGRWYGFLLICSPIVNSVWII